MPLDGDARVLYRPEKGTLSGTPCMGVVAGLCGTLVGLAQERTDAAPEAFLCDTLSSATVRVSRANDALSELPLGETSRLRWQAADGADIEGLLTLPVDYRCGLRCPLVLEIHGGPQLVFTESFNGTGIIPAACLAAQGYAVLRCNIRGSSGYGKAFRFANLNDWGGKDFEDLMAGVDYVISLGLADPDRLAVVGWSYGGYMTAWTITHTRRFKAAVVGAGLTNLWSFIGTSDVPSLVEDYLAKSDGEDIRRSLRHSPLFYVNEACIPTLILHGQSDERVPVSQSSELYRALRRRGTVTKVVVYPRTGHMASEPRVVLDIMERHLEWLQRYLG